MKVAAVCALLLATFTSGSCDDSFISLVNNGEFQAEIKWSRSTGTETTPIGQKQVPTGGTEKITLAEGDREVDFNIYALNKDSPKGHIKLVGSYHRKITKLCFKTWGTAADPHIGQTDCSAKGEVVDAGSVDVKMTNTGTESASLVLKYKIKSEGDMQVQQEWSVNPGEDRTFALPKEAHAIFIILRHKSGEITPARLSMPLRMCLKFWNTADKLDSAQVDC